MRDSEIDRVAIAWTARIDAGPLDAAAEAELEAWRNADPRHEGAFVRASAAWMVLDRARALSNGTQVDRRARLARSRRRLIRRCATAVAACAAAAVVVVAVDRAQGTTDTLRTPDNQITRAQLADGSVVVLNSGAVLKTRLTWKRRYVTIERGEAWFKVAPDHERPFVVTVGSGRAQALGTAFIARLKGGEAEILVTEGVVAVKDEDAGGPPSRVGAGWKATVASSGTVLTARSSPDELDRTLIWREGQIVLRGTPLGEAARQFNLYNRRKISIPDRSLAEERMVGWFSINDPDAFAAAAAKITDAELQTSPQRIVLSQRPK